MWYIFKAFKSYCTHTDSANCMTNRSDRPHDNSYIPLTNIVRWGISKAESLLTLYQLLSQKLFITVHYFLWSLKAMCPFPCPVTLTHHHQGTQAVWAPPEVCSFSTCSLAGLWSPCQWSSSQSFSQQSIHHLCKKQQESVGYWKAKLCNSVLLWMKLTLKRGITVSLIKITHRHLNVKLEKPSALSQYLMLLK